MKKITLLLLVTFSNLCLAQQYQVTPTGLRDASKLENAYVVIPTEGKTAKELYEATLKYIAKNYKNPEEVIKGNVEGEFIKFETYAPDFIMVKNSGAKIMFDAKYTTEVSFKEGKVKYEIIELSMTNDANYQLNFTGGGLSYFIFNKKGELKKEDVKNSIETYFNSQISTLTSYLQGKDTEDKW